MSSKSTATPDNALLKEEVDERLASRALARLATYREDGMIHLTPIWFTWDGERFRLTLGAGRVHSTNLRRDARVSILIDEDPRVEQGLGAGAWAVMVRGTAELSQDTELIRTVTLDVLTRALGLRRRAAVPRADHGRGADDRDDHAFGLVDLGLQQGRVAKCAS